MSQSVIITHEEADSTNLLAKQMIVQGYRHGSVVRALRQSSGRGQYGRPFASPSGGLYFSLILQPNLEPQCLPLATLATGLACREVLLSETGLEALIKWPNDLYLHDRKIAGILCESVSTPDQLDSQPWIVVGVGVNVNSLPSDFSPELRPLLTTLRASSDKMYDCDLLLTSLVQRIEQRIGMLSSNCVTVLDLWQSCDYLKAKQIVYTAGLVHLVGTGYGIDSTGAYQLVDSKGDVHRIIGGQVRPVATCEGIGSL